MPSPADILSVVLNLVHPNSIQGLPMRCHSSSLNSMLGSINVKPLIFQCKLNFINSIIILIIIHYQKSSSLKGSSECDIKIGRPLPQWSVTVGDVQRTRATNFEIRLLAGCDGLKKDAVRFRSRNNGISPADPSLRGIKDWVHGFLRLQCGKIWINFMPSEEA